MLRSWGLLHAGITASKPAILARAVGYQTKPQQILSRHPECVDPHDGGRDQIKGVLSRETQSIGIRVFTQMPAPSNENCPPMLTVRFDCGTLDPGAKEPGRAQCAMPFAAP
jgi:hypothetical protein